VNLSDSETPTKTASKNNNGPQNNTTVQNPGTNNFVLTTIDNYQKQLKVHTSSVLKKYLSFESNKG